MPVSAKIKKRAAAVLAHLKARYPQPPTNLNASTPWQQIVATVLSAQCTDARVNMVTPELFRRWPTAEALAEAEITDLEAVIHSVGFYHAKASNIIKAAIMIRDVFHGQVPRTIEELVRLPGVARKTANVVLYTQFGINAGLAVDTHVNRIANRLGLTSSQNPTKVEQDLMKLFPQADWGFVNHSMVWFGREVCLARRPQCGMCGMAEFCPEQLGKVQKLPAAQA